MTEPGLLLVPAAAYLAAGGLYGRYLYSKRTDGAPLATSATLFAMLLHIALLLARAASAPYAPLASMAESLSLFGILAAGAFLLLQRSYHAPALGCVALPVSCAAAVAASVLSPERVAELPETLRSPWFFIHIPLCFLGYVALVLAFGASLLYLLHDRLLRQKRLGVLHRHLPPLHVLEDMARRLLALGFPIFTAGIITGAFWAQAVWGHYWDWQPKQSAALVTWLLYAAALHTRALASWRGRKFAWLLSCGFASIVASYVIVTLANPGMHSFR